MSKPPRELQDLGFGIHLVPLTKGYFAIIDSVSADEVGKHCWCARESATGKVYAMRTVNRKCVMMHRFVSGLDCEVDHKNGDGLDNRTENLRPAAKDQNQFNRGKQRNNSSGFKGVSWQKQKGRWQAQIRANGKTRHLGLFHDPKEAHAAYVAAAERLHGEFARSK